MARKPTQQQRLEALARQMRDQLVARPGWLQLPTSDGLTVVLQRNDDRWRLALGRQNARPTTDEIEICAGAFGVPVGAEPAFSDSRRPHPKTGRPVGWHIAELRWIEPVAST